MTHEEMSNFTNEELSNFSHLELSLESTELIINLVNDFRDDIPSSVIIKLERICRNFISSCEQNNIEIPSEITELKNKKSVFPNRIFCPIRFFYKKGMTEMYIIHIPIK